MHRSVRLLLAGALSLAMIAFPVIAQAASSGQGAGDTVTWMVRPSDGRTEDGRSWIELDLDPGESVVEHLLVRNLSSSSVKFQLSAADGYFTATGRFTMLTSGRKSTNAGTWIKMQDAVEVASGADAVVPFTVTVPDNATPGDYPAGVAAGVRSGDGEVGVESRVGFRVMTRVKGKITPSLQTRVSGTYAGSFNPFAPGTAAVSYTVTNTGNARLAVNPSATVSGPFGWFAQHVAFDPIAEIAPGESRTLTAKVHGVWPLFMAILSAQAKGSAVSDGLDIGTVPASAGSATVPAVPWPQLVVCLLLALVAAGFWYERRRRHRRTTELIERVRAETRAEAGDTARGRVVTDPRSV